MMELQLFDAPRRSAAERALLMETTPPSEPSSSYLRFGEDYFDTPDLGRGYAGYKYDGRFKDTAKRIVDHYGLTIGSKVMEIGCAKGFLLIEFQLLGMEVEGWDLSEYAVNNAHPDIRERINLGDASEIPTPDNPYDLVIAKEVLSHMPDDSIRKTLRFMQNQSRASFAMVSTVTAASSADVMLRWDPTYKTARTPDQWVELFQDIGYRNDYQLSVIA